MATEYRYHHFTTKLLFHDLRFHKAAKRPGETLPEFDLPTTEAARIASDDFLGSQPLLLVTGSMTCPMTASAIPSLKRLHAQCGDDVAFVMLNIREAHPGENYPQPETLEDKADHARALKDTYQMPWTVAVDDLDGTLNIAMDGKPNSTYLMDRDGKIVFRSIWGRDEDNISRALESVKRDEPPAKRESRAMVRPLVSAVGSVHEVIRRAGPRAARSLAIKPSDGVRRAGGVAVPAAIARQARGRRGSHAGHSDCLGSRGPTFVVRVSISIEREMDERGVIARWRN